MTYSCFGTTQITFGTTQITFGTTQITFGTAQIAFGTTQIAFGTRNSCRRVKMGRMKHDDFFAPRPKLSWQMRAIRTGALLAAVGISLGFFMLDWVTFSRGVYGIPQPTLQDEIFRLIVPTLVQIALLVPCWRCWLLHRWACIVTTVMLFILVPSTYSGEMMDFPSVNLFGAITAVCVAACIGAEWRNLKSGF